MTINSHSPANCQAVIGNGMIPRTLLPELMNCTPTMEIDYNIMMNQMVTDIERPTVIMSEYISDTHIQ